MAESFLSKLLFTILKIICWAVNRLTQLFEIFSGLTKVSFNGERIFLFDVFLNNTTINNIYWGMALIGIVLCFGFAIFAVIRKMFDASGRVQMSIGQIITEGLKSIILILSMNAILTVTLTGTDILMRQVNYLFTNADGLSQAESITYTDEQCAAMGRALGTIANYGMNPSFNSRYNLNDCFNTIRPDLMYLEDQGVFDYHYPQDSNSWQSILQEVAASADLRYELKADVYYENVAKSLQHALDVMRTDASFRPLEKFKKENTALLQIPLDRIIFLSGTLDAANNSYYNVKPSFMDALRYPYYSGEKSLYDTDTVDSIDVISSDFSISYARFDYLVSIVLGIAILVNTFLILLSLVARMFNILLLYVISPPVLAVRPLDGGGKSKQWTIAFMIQALGVFGNIIVMRLLLIFVPVIFDADLILIEDSAALNYFAKAVMLLAAYAVAKKASGLITGIISDSAAMQSIQAGDMSDTAKKAFGAAKFAAGVAAAPAINYLSRPLQAWRSLGQPKKKDDSGGSNNNSGGNTGEALPGSNRSGGGKQGGKGGNRPGLPKPPVGRGRSQSMPNPSNKGGSGLPNSAKQGPPRKEGGELPNPMKQGPSQKEDGDLPQSAKQEVPSEKEENAQVNRPRGGSMPNLSQKGGGGELPQSAKQELPSEKEENAQADRPRSASMWNSAQKEWDGELPQSAKQKEPSGKEENVPFDQRGPGNGVPMPPPLGGPGGFSQQQDIGTFSGESGPDNLPGRSQFNGNDGPGQGQSHGSTQTNSIPSGTSQSGPRQRSYSAPTNSAASGTSQPGPRQRSYSAPTNSVPSGTSQPEPRQRSYSAPTNSAAFGTSQSGLRQRSYSAPTNSAASGTSQPEPRQRSYSAPTNSVPSGTSQPEPRQRSYSAPTNSVPSGTSQPEPRQRSYSAPTNSVPSGTSQPEPRQRSYSAPTNSVPSGTSQPEPRQSSYSTPTNTASSGTSQPEPRQRSYSAPTNSVPSGATQPEPRQSSYSTPTNTASSGTSQPGQRQRSYSAPTNSVPSGTSQPEPRQRSYSAPTNSVPSGTSQHEPRQRSYSVPTNSVPSGDSSSAYPSTEFTPKAEPTPGSPMKGTADRQTWTAQERRESIPPKDPSGRRSSFRDEEDQNQ